MAKTIEITVRPRTVYHVTIWHGEALENGNEAGGSESIGTFDNVRNANRVACAMHAARVGGDGVKSIKLNLLDEPTGDLPA